MKPRWYFMRVTNDKYELPLCVAESVKELAEMAGVRPNSINVALGREEKGKKKTHARKRKYKYIKVEMPEDMDEDDAGSMGGVRPG